LTPSRHTRAKSLPSHPIARAPARVGASAIRTGGRHVRQRPPTDGLHPPRSDGCLPRVIFA
jgi:hypothetical protein